MLDQISTMIESFRAFWSRFLSFVPKLALGILLFLGGWLLAKLVRAAIIAILKFLRVDAAAEKAGMEDFLLRGGVQYSPVVIVANICYWLLILALTFAVVTSLGIGDAEDLFNRMLNYIPVVVTAVLVLIFGSLFAGFVRETVSTYLSNAGMTGTELISSVVQWIIMVIVVFTALDQLSIGGQVLIVAFELAFGGLCLALAIAFGLAGKDWAAQVLEKIRRRTR